MASACHHALQPPLPTPPLPTTQARAPVRDELLEDAVGVLTLTLTLTLTLILTLTLPLPLPLPLPLT